MLKQSVLCGIILYVLFSEVNGELLADIKRCKAGDELCLVDTINEVIATKYAGDPQLNLLSIDPLKIPELILKQPKDSPVNLDMVMKNIEIYGYKNLKAFKVRGFGANPEGNHEVYLKLPAATMLGDYTATGNIFSMLVQGDGVGNVTLGESDFHLIITAGSIIKGGSIYMDVKNVEFNLETKRAYVNFSNIVSGNKELSDQLNKFLDENWHDFYLQVKRTFLDAVGLVFKDILHTFFDSHPYSELVEGGN